jgi:hypothetical protein
MKPKKFDHEGLLKDAGDRIQAKLVAAKRGQEEPEPAGWFNAEQLASAMGIDTCNVARNMRLIKAPTRRILRFSGNCVRKITYWKP